MASATSPEDLEPFMENSEPDTYQFICNLMDSFDLKLNQVILDCEHDAIEATAMIEQGETSKTLSLTTRDAVGITGRIQAPLYATTRVFDRMTFSEGDATRIKKESIYPNQDKITWEHFFRKALEQNADQVRFMPK